MTKLFYSNTIEGNAQISALNVTEGEVFSNPDGFMAAVEAMLSSDMNLCDVPDQICSITRAAGIKESTFRDVDGTPESILELCDDLRSLNLFPEDVLLAVNAFFSTISASDPKYSRCGFKVWMRLTPISFIDVYMMIEWFKTSNSIKPEAESLDIWKACQVLFARG